jgi:hypothetical protein
MSKIKKAVLAFMEELDEIEDMCTYALMQDMCEDLVRDAYRTDFTPSECQLEDAYATAVHRYKKA